MTFGARMLKTGIAVTLALYISTWLQLTAPVIAAVAAIFAMQPSIYRSWRYFLDQIQTNTLGAIVALLAGYFLSNDPIIVGLVCIIVIMVCLKLKMGETIGLTLVTVIAVMEASGHWQFAVTRFTLSLIGIVSAFLINVLVFPPNPKAQFEEQIEKIFSQLSLLLRTAVSDEIRETVFRDEKRELVQSIKALSDKYYLLEEEQRKLKRPSYSKSRHLVVYKQMLYTLRKGRAVLDAIEQHYFQSERSKATDTDFDQQIEKLIKFHEHILLKFRGKVKPNNSEAYLVEEENEEFIKKIIERYSHDKTGALRLSVVAASMYDYGYQLERINRLVDHYNKFDHETRRFLSWTRFKKS